MCFKVNFVGNEIDDCRLRRKQNFQPLDWVIVVLRPRLRLGLWTTMTQSAGWKFCFRLSLQSSISYICSTETEIHIFLRFDEFFVSGNTWRTVVYLLNTGIGDCCMEARTETEFPIQGSSGRFDELHSFFSDSNHCLKWSKNYLLKNHWIYSWNCFDGKTCTL